ncbi:hypothetical protein THIOM_001614 [Candidatus Thiomargarita nelsonii]|uniref:Rossmann fold nucleotide-binding protein n=1 Tax=Candidatus Thiomargarita nelsonii TaxID=1003181 RepID=A0A176S3R0_9GAMM|nr:hypothetical protein THIOM_001614 [Candidatus Thiomargarita nelsonii]
MSTSFEEIAASITERLGQCSIVAVIGSASFWHPESQDTCICVGRELATIPSLSLITGGVEGVGETVGRSFHESRVIIGEDPKVFHLLPHGYGSWDYGETMFAGSNMYERREVLGRVSKLYLSIEGGPGTKHEATVAMSNGAVVIPVGRSGGYSGELYSTRSAAELIQLKHWHTIGSQESTTDSVGASVKQIVSVFLRNDI